MMNKTVLFVLLVVVSIGEEIESKEILARGVSTKEQKEIVDAHNEYRLLIQRGKVPKQPRSIDMKELCWDNDLAKAAQRIADEMIFEHQPVEDDRWNHIGQNLAEKSLTSNKTGSDWKWAVKLWFSEVKYYTYGDMPTRGTGHYTQLIWAKTTHVGCGYTHYSVAGDRLKYHKLFVCNYGPGGNIGGMAPYKTGRCGCKGLCRARCKTCAKNETNINIK